MVTHMSLAVRMRGVRMRGLAQGHHNTQLGGAGDRTSNLAVTGQPTLPPELKNLVKVRGVKR